MVNSITICKLVDLISAALHYSDCRIPNWLSVKTVHSSSTNHGQTTACFRSFFQWPSGSSNQKRHHFEIIEAFRFVNWYFFFVSGLEHIFVRQFKGISLLVTYMAKQVCEWIPRFTVAIVVRVLMLVTSLINCDVDSCPIFMRRYENADGDEQQARRRKSKFSLIFLNMVIAAE